MFYLLTYLLTYLVILQVQSPSITGIVDYYYRYSCLVLQVDVQLNSTMRLISGTLRSTPLPWLPVFSNIEPPDL